MSSPRITYSTRNTNRTFVEGTQCVPSVPFIHLEVDVNVTKVYFSLPNCEFSVVRIFFYLVYNILYSTFYSLYLFALAIDVANIHVSIFHHYYFHSIQMIHHYPNHSHDYLNLVVNDAIASLLCHN